MNYVGSQGMLQNQDNQQQSIETVNTQHLGPKEFLEHQKLMSNRTPEEDNRRVMLREESEINLAQVGDVDIQL